MSALTLLDARRSVPSSRLGAPGPDPMQQAMLIESALRVPDHGRLEPWRILRVEGDARARLGAGLARAHASSDPDVVPSALDKDRQRFDHAPLILLVVARITPGHKVPEIEQMLSAGCVAYNLLLGAQCLGFGAQWLTGWAAYDANVHALLGIGHDERVVAFVHIGTPTEQVLERTRPDTGSLVTDWTG